MKGLLIVLEGIDGCGKTTQINHLSKWLPQSGLMPKNSKLHLTREPGGTELGAELRKLLLASHYVNTPEPIAELLLYAADRAQHVSEVILPALRKGDWVLSDRFSGSTFAYQGFGRNLNLEIIEQLEKIATQDITPHISILLDISVKESLRRRRKYINDRIEEEGEDFLEKVSLGFRSLAQKRNWITISANNDPQFISMEIQKSIYKYLQDI